MTKTTKAAMIQPIRKNRIGVTSHDAGRSTRYYYVTGVLTNWHQTSGITTLSELANESDEPTRTLAETLLAIPGVAEIMWLQTSRLILVINPMYLWEEVQGQVVTALLTRLGWEESDTSIVSYEDFQKLAKEHDATSVPADRLV